MKASFHSAAAIASLCVASAAFCADEVQPGNMGQPAPMSQPAPNLDVTQLPPAAQATLQREGRVSKVVQVTDSGARVYEATISKDGRNYSVQVTGDGTILSREAPQQ